MGIYSGLEGKWYDTVDSLGLGGIIDKIDSIVPSFMLFIGIILILVIFLITTLITSGPRNFDAEILVTSSDGGKPIGGAEITLSAECLEKQGLTNSGSTDNEGKLTLTICNSDLFSVSVAKTGYQTYSDKIAIMESTQVPITLEETITPKEFNARIVDESDKIIKNAKLQMICVNDPKNKLDLPEKAGGTQPADGFTFTLISNCSEIQLNASAQGYIDEKGKEVSTKTVSQSDERWAFKMKKNVATGNVTFEVQMDNEPAEGVDITLSTEERSAIKMITDESGAATTSQPIQAGDYSYVAIAKNGAVDSNSFTLGANENKTIKIFMKKPKDKSKIKQLYLKISDEAGNAVSSAKYSLFKMPDGNLFIEENSNANGLVQRTIPDGNYFVAVKKIGYQTAIVEVALKNDGEEPQQILLSQGGATIKTHVIDETKAGIKGANITLRIAGFSGVLEKVLSDSNGTYEFRGLPPGDYTIKVSTESAQGEGTVSVATNQSKEITISLTISEGKIAFNLSGADGTKINANYQLYVRNGASGNFVKQSEGVTTKNVFDTGMLKYGTEVKAIVGGGTYIPYETMVYKIQKTTATSPVNIFIELRTLSGLPNPNNVQMFLTDIYETSPLAGGKSKPASVDKILAGKNYHMLFDLVLLDGNDTTTITNFFVGPKDQAGLLTKNPFIINGAYSIEGAVTVLSNVHEAFEIPNNQNIVDTGAKQGNVLLGKKSGPITIPVVLVVQTDLNAEGKEKIFYEAKFGDRQSLQYSKEFEFGKKFCTKNCPAFLISSYLKTGGGNYEPISDSNKPILYIGESYKLKTIVENLLEEDIGTPNLIVESKTKTGNEYAIVFPVGGDSNSDSNAAVASITLAPLSTSTPAEFNVKPNKTSSSAKVDEYLSKLVDGVNALKKYDGSSVSMSVQVKEKSGIEISISPERIDSGEEYPLFVVKAKGTTTKKGVPASIYYSVEGGGMIYMGTADENGLLISEFSAVNLGANTKVLFTAEKSGMVSGTKEIIISAPYSPIPGEPVEPECLAISADANKALNISINGTGTFGLTSTCTEARRIYLQTDLPVSKKIVDLAPGGSETIKVTAAPRDGLLGIYPVQVLAIKGAKYRQLGIVDVVINDPNSCFEISKTAFDFKNEDTVSGTITNKCFAGRKDNFNPQMNVQTNSVSLEYDKPGIPEKITSKVSVMGMAPEGYFSGLMKSNIHFAADIECEGAIDIPETPEAALEGPMEEAAGTCEGQAQKMNELRNKKTPKPEPDLNETKVTPDKVLQPSEVKSITGPASEIIPSTPAAAKTSSGGFAPPSEISKIKKLSFQEEGGDGEGEGEGMPSEEGEGGAPTEGEGPPEGSESCAVIPSGSTVDYIYSWYTDPYCGGGYGAFRPKEPDGDEFGSGPWWKLRGEGIEGSTAVYEVLEAGGPDTTHEVAIAERFGEGGAGMYYQLLVQSEGSGGWGSSFCHGAYLKIQNDWFSMYENISGRYNTVTKEFTLVPIEGKAYPLGSYSEATPMPAWMGDMKPYEHSQGDSWTLSENAGSSLYTLVCGFGEGFLDPEYAASVTKSDADKTPNILTRVWFVFDANHPHVEFDSSGKIQYFLYTEEMMKYGEAYIKSLVNYNGIPPEPDKDGLRYFLKNHQIWAEYVGKPTIASNVINFSLTNNNLLGDEYSILTVKDWINGTEKEKKAFQIKLSGNPSSCYSSDGTIGATGKGFSPKLLFDWDWANIPENQCDSSNEDYTYCDGTQFTTALFKKLYKIDEYTTKGKIEELPTITAFYSYLIKDNYTKEFLGDFSEYYSNTLANADTKFTGTYNKFITQNKIKFTLDDSGGPGSACEESATGIPETINILPGSPATQFFALPNEVSHANIVKFKATDNEKCATAEIRLGGSGEWIDLGDVGTPAAEKEFNLGKDYGPVRAVEVRVKEKESEPSCGTESVAIESIKVGGNCASGGQEGGNLPSGGLYRITIDYNLLDPSLRSLLDKGEPNASINVKFKLIQPAPNYNPFYETPFDGEVGKKNDQFVRHNYGVSVDSPGTETLKLNSNVSSAKYSGAMDTITHTTTKDLAKLDKQIILTYNKEKKTLEFNPAQPTPVIFEIKADADRVDAQYTLSGSISGTLPSKKWRMVYSNIGKKECYDFSDQHKVVFNDREIAPNKRGLAWDVRKKGTIGLGTTFFTPKATDIRIAPIPGRGGKIIGFEQLTNADAITLNYFDAAATTEYDSLEKLFKMIDNKQVCVSTGSSSEVKIWWNPEYLDGLASQINAGTGYTCNQEQAGAK
ncbi:MAG: carboxypeptidase regulatory-like domain-containing protein [Candidatus Diapherotrites archaeon]|nr:carboxypeptidase regulatory-like domain-containing protein [Candidatus Diapherotrites archaeon]